MRIAMNNKLALKKKLDKDRELFLIDKNVTMRSFEKTKKNINITWMLAFWKLTGNCNQTLSKFSLCLKNKLRKAQLNQQEENRRKCTRNETSADYFTVFTSFFTLFELFWTINLTKNKFNKKFSILWLCFCVQVTKHNDLRHYTNVSRRKFFCYIFVSFVIFAFLTKRRFVTHNKCRFWWEKREWNNFSTFFQVVEIASKKFSDWSVNKLRYITTMIRIKNLPESSSRVKKP